MSSLGGKVEMSPPWQSRNVAFCTGLSGMRVNLRVPVKRRRALLRNSLPRDEVKTEFTGLDPEFHSLPILNTALQFLEDGRVVFLAGCDHVVDDTGEFVGRRSHRLRRAEPGLHAPKVIPEEGLTPVQPLRCHPQGERRPVLGWSRS